MKRYIVQLLITAYCLTFDQAVLGDAEEELARSDFSLRLPSALSKFSAAGDVAGVGGASAGSPYSSGINPASIEWSSTLERPFIFSPEFSRIRFDTNPELRVATVTGSANTKSSGGYQLTFSKVSSNESPDLDFIQLEGDYAQIQWGKKFSDKVAVGSNLNYTSFNTIANLDGVQVADGKSNTRGGRAGILVKASQRMLAGLVVDYATANTISEYFDIECFCNVTAEDNTYKTVMLRTGINFEYQTLSSVYLDLSVGRFRNSAQSMTSKALFLGIEHQLFPWLYTRAGIAHDFRGVNGTTFGVGIIPSEHFSVDLAYQRDVFPELLPEFGEAEVLNLSVNLSF